MRRLLVALSCALVLAGCGGDPKADPSPAPSSPTTAVSTTPTPPVMPEAAKANTKAGAVAFVKYYISVQNFAARSGSIATLSRLVEPTCGECVAVPNFIEKTYSHGGRIVGTGWDVLSTTPVSDAPGPTDLTYVDIKVRINEQTVYSSPSASPSTYAGEAQRTLSLGLDRGGDSWRLAKIVVAKQ